MFEVASEQNVDERRIAVIVVATTPEYGMVALRRCGTAVNEVHRAPARQADADEVVPTGIRFTNEIARQRELDRSAAPAR